MTMKDNKCEICRVNQPIGVASTIMPYSCAYCAECCRRFAQPMIVFECFWEEVGTNFGRLADGIDQLETYDCGRYQTYREWATRRAGADQLYNGCSGEERPGSDPDRGTGGGDPGDDSGHGPV